MKNLFVLLTIFFFNFSQGQIVTKDGDYYELTFISEDPNEAHNSANIFTQKIGDILKSSYPSRIVDPSVKIRVFIKNGKKNYKFWWSCRIIKTTVTHADYYFDRRGTLLFGESIEIAKSKVENHLLKSGKVLRVRESFKNTNIPEDFIQESFSGSKNEGYWYLKEIFIVAPK